MEPHRLAERRSLAYHRVVAERLVREPQVVERARARVREWLRSAPAPHYAVAWDAVLARPVDEIIAFLTHEGDDARELRQSTPFAGALDPRERWRLWRAVAEAERAGA